MKSGQKLGNLIFKLKWHGNRHHKLFLFPPGWMVFKLLRQILWDTSRIMYVGNANAQT